MTSYIGIEPSFGTFDKQLITGNGSTTTYDLDFAVAQAGQIMVSLDGIVQEPDYAFNISLSSIFVSPGSFFSISENPHLIKILERVS